MKQIVTTIIAFILSSLSVGALAKFTSEKILWQEYSPNVFEQAKAAHRPVIMLGKQKDCHWCEQMEATTFSNPTVVKLINHSYTPVMIEMGRNRDIFIQYKILRLPTTIIFDVNGKVVKVASGCIQAKRMIDILKR